MSQTAIKFSVMGLDCISDSEKVLFIRLTQTDVLKHFQKTREELWGFLGDKKGNNKHGVVG